MQFDKDHEAIVRIDLKEVLELMSMYITIQNFAKSHFIMSLRKDSFVQFQS